MSVQFPRRAHLATPKTAAGASLTMRTWASPVTTEWRPLRQTYATARVPAQGHLMIALFRPRAFLATPKMAADATRTTRAWGLRATTGTRGPSPTCVTEPVCALGAPLAVHRPRCARRATLRTGVGAPPITQISERPAMTESRAHRTTCAAALASAQATATSAQRLPPVPRATSKMGTGASPTTLEQAQAVATATTPPTATCATAQEAVQEPPTDVL